MKQDDERRTKGNDGEDDMARLWWAIWSIARQLCGRLDEADDLTQKAFLAVVRARLRRGGDKPAVAMSRAVMYKAVQWAYLSEGRSGPSRRRRERSFGESAWQTAEARAQAVDPAAVAELGDRSGLLVRVLAELPAEQRSLIQWRLLEDLPFKIVGERLGISEAAAGMRYIRLLETLRTHPGLLQAIRGA